MLSSSALVAQEEREVAAEALIAQINAGAAGKDPTFVSTEVAAAMAASEKEEQDYAAAEDVTEDTERVQDPDFKPEGFIDLTAADDAVEGTNEKKRKGQSKEKAEAKKSKGKKSKKNKDKGLDYDPVVDSLSGLEDHIAAQQANAEATQKVLANLTQAFIQSQANVPPAAPSAHASPAAREVHPSVVDWSNTLVTVWATSRFDDSVTAYLTTNRITGEDFEILTPDMLVEGGVPKLQVARFFKALNTLCKDGHQAD